MRLLINLATYGRRAQAIETLRNVEETISVESDYEVIVSCDLIDLQMNSADVVMEVMKFKNTSIYFGEHTSKVGAINRFVHKAKKNWKVLVNMSDDFRFTQKNWDKVIISDAREAWGDSSDFLSHYPDGFVNHRLNTMQIIGREFYDRTGEVYCSEYNSVSCDSDAFWVSQLLGKYKYFDKHLFVHNHPANTRDRVTDETYLGNDKFDKIDCITYWKRMKWWFGIPEDKIVFFPNQLVEERNNLLRQ